MSYKQSIDPAPVNVATCPGAIYLESIGPTLRTARSSGERVNELEKREAMEIGIARDDAPYAVFPHEDRGVRIMKDVAR